MQSLFTGQKGVQKTGQLQKIRSQANLNAIVENFDGFVWSIDTNLEYIVLNTALRDKIKQCLGVEAKPGDKVMDILEMIDPFKTRAWSKIYQGGFAGETQRFIDEYSIAGRNAYYEISVNPIRDGETISGLSCFARDITERVHERNKAEKIIRESEYLYRNLFNYSPLPIWVCDAATLRFLEVNEAAIQQYGYSRNEFLRMTAYGIIPPHEHEELRYVWAGACNTNKRLQRNHLKRNGGEIFVEVLVHLVNYKGQDSYLVLANDITEKIRLQHQLIEEKLHRQQEVIKATIEATEKEREGIGRELHDNVTQILTTAKLCLGCISDHPASRDMIERSSNTITSAIEEIRSLSRSMIQSFHREIGLKLSIEDLADSIRVANKFHITLNFFLPDEHLLDDKLKMTLFRIIQEQLNNIIKHAEASAVDISISQQNNTLYLAITDNGKGFNVHEKRKGIGITNITNRAELFNGQVYITSSPGNGCRMEVSFALR